MKTLSALVRNFCNQWIWVGLLATFLPSPAAGQVVISEFMANESEYSLTVGNSTYTGDWIELYNTSSSSVNLSYWAVTTGTNLPPNVMPQYSFPPGTTIGPNGYLLLYCDGGVLTNFHTSFKLSSSGETVYLLNSSYLTNDIVSYGRQLADLSSGRVGGTTNWGLCVPTPAMVNQAYALTGTVFALRINEWAATNYKADLSPDDDWLEIYNMTNKPVQIGGVVMADTNNPAPTKYLGLVQAFYLEPYGVLDFKCDGKKNSPPDHLNFKLSSTSGQMGLESIFMFDANRTNLIDQISFPGYTQDPTYWTGNTSYGRLPDGSPNIVLFPIGRTTKGKSNFLPVTNLVFSEILAHTDPPLEDAIELYNPTTNAVDIGDWWLSNAQDDPKKYRIPAGTVVPALGYKVIYEYAGVSNQVNGYFPGFNPSGRGTNRSMTLNSAQGDEVFLFSASNDASGTLTGLKLNRDFAPSANGVSFGRYRISDGSTDFTAMSRRTFGADTPTTVQEFRQGTGLPNAYPLVGPLVITEIMYHPPDIIQGTNILDNSLDEYIEVYNITPNTVFLYDTNGIYSDPHYGVYADGRTNTWRFRGVVDYNFPTNQSLGSGQYFLLVNFDPDAATNATQLAAFKAKYNVPAGLKLYGPYGNKLANNHGSVELYKPDPPQAPDRPDAGDVPRILVDRVKYDDTDPWPVMADGGGAALHRLVPREYGNDPTNWVAYAPTPGRPLNTPPTLNPIADANIDELRLLTFTNTASDADIPAQALTFSLGPGAPVRATISPNGIFRWRPSEAQGPGTNIITVIVNDSGMPSLSATQTFTVRVREVNQPPIFNIRKQYVRAGDLLTFPTAFDYDLPPQRLAFTFTNTPVVPAGMTLDAVTGVITWTPNDAQAGQVYTVTVRAEDDGAPRLSASCTYEIEVIGRDTEENLSKSWFTAESAAPSGQFQIHWQAVIGKTYQVLYATNIDQELWSWTPLWIPEAPASPAGEIVADKVNMTATDTNVVTGPPRRFYYIQCLSQ